MANHRDRRPLGERFTPRRVADFPKLRSTLHPLPYFPNLKLILRSVTASMVISYLEICHPAPEATNRGLASAPISLDLDTACRDLQVSRRTLGLALRVLASWWRDEETRGRAARAGREFLNPAHTQNGAIKAYSATGPKSTCAGTVIVIRRNRPKLAQMLELAGISSIDVRPSALNNLVPEMAAPCNSLQGPPFPVEIESLAEIMLRASVLSGDRRSVRYPRLRAAIKRGLVGPEALKLHSSPSR